jgi:hypothetical protein
MKNFTKSYWWLIPTTLLYLVGGLDYLIYARPITSTIVIRLMGGVFVLFAIINVLSMIKIYYKKKISKIIKDLG